MIVIIICLLFAFYMFWHFDRQRKLKKAEHQREKREAFMNLLDKLRQTDSTNTAKKQ